MTIPNTHFHHVQKPDQTGNEEICLEYTVSSFRSATYFEPSEGGEVEIIKAWTEPSGVDYFPTDDEAEKWAQEIAETHDHSDHGDEGI